MNTTPARSLRSAWADRALIAVFLALLAAPALDCLFHLDHSRPPGENRLPAPPPRLEQANLAGLKKFVAGTEAYFNDHFGFRKKLIRWHQNWKIGLFHDRSVYNVIAGRDGWLFASDLQMVEHHLGLARFTPQQLEQWRQVFEKRRDWLAARGIHYLVVIPPDKQTVYPEQLPNWLRDAAPAHRETKLDQFLKHMQAHSTVEILDLRQPLTAAKQVAPTYLQNDTHWNLFGGFVACQEVVKTLSGRLPDLPRLELASFDWSNAPAVGGDLARMIGSDAAEKNYYAFTPKPGVWAPRNRPATNIISRWDAHKLSILSENPGPATETAVVFHDSFGNAWQQFLGYSFKRIVFMSENREFNEQVIAAEQPKVVINEMLERYFNTQDPGELLVHDALP